MKRFLIFLSFAFLLATGLVKAQPPGPYTLRWTTTAAATTAEAGPYLLNATIGQAEAGVQSGGDYDLGGGFWGGGAPPAPLPSPDEALYLPLLTRP